MYYPNVCKFVNMILSEDPMRGTKKFIGIIISLSILFLCFFSFGADAADGFSVFSTGATAHTGETVTISIKIPKSPSARIPYM